MNSNRVIDGGASGFGTHAPRPASVPRRIFFGPARLRAGWRLAIYLVLTHIVGGELHARALQAMFGRGRVGWTFTWLTATEALAFAITLIAVVLMSRIEKRSLAAYGFTGRGAFGCHFWTGTLWGLVAVSALVALVALLGGASFGGLAIHGTELMGYALGWLVTMTLIGLAEELNFRGYLQATLTDAIGFWPAAIVISVAFGALHYFRKPFETPVDFASVALIGLFFCLTLRRTGTLWWAIGFHAGFDYAQLVLFGGPNSGNRGQSLATRLLDVSWRGSEWLTGGRLGLEASLLVFPIIAASFALFAWRYRESRFPRSEVGEDLAAPAVSVGGSGGPS